MPHKPCDTGEDVLAVLERTYLLDRHAATAGSWKALDILNEYLDIEVHSFASGSECFTWRVPPGWAVEHAEIRLGDRVLLRHADHPLTVQPYSDSFTGRVGRDDLLKHLVWSEARPDAYAYRSQLAYQTDLRRDWQMSLPWALVRDLPEGDYDVDLRTRFFDGAMPVGEALLEGDSPHSILIVAHICHPGIADDGLSGAVTGIRLMRWLATLPRRRYTYRLLLPVETIGSVAWLWKRRDLLPHLAAGLVLESLGNAAPFAWKRSYPGDTRIDRVARHVARRFGEIEERDFRDKVGNDELVFGDPDFAVPMVGLQRWPYPEYHTSDDAPAALTAARLDEGFAFARGIVEVLEADAVPERRFVGPLHLSRHDLYVDARQDFALYSRIWRIMQMMDGETTLFDIAEATGLDFAALQAYLDRWREKGLIRDRALDPRAVFPRGAPMWLVCGRD